MITLSTDYCDHYKIGLRSGVKKDYYELFNNASWINTMTFLIEYAGRTVYLKESTRELLRRCATEEIYNRILSRTVDMDGNKINI